MEWHLSGSYLPWHTLKGFCFYFLCVETVPPHTGPLVGSGDEHCSDGNLQRLWEHEMGGQRTRRPGTDQSEIRTWGSEKWKWTFQWRRFPPPGGKFSAHRGEVFTQMAQRCRSRSNAVSITLAAVIHFHGIFFKPINQFYSIWQKEVCALALAIVLNIDESESLLFNLIPISLSSNLSCIQTEKTWHCHPCPTYYEHVQRIKLSSVLKPVRSESRDGDIQTGSDWTWTTHRRVERDRSSSSSSSGQDNHRHASSQQNFIALFGAQYLYSTFTNG